MVSAPICHQAVVVSGRGTAVVVANKPARSEVVARREASEHLLAGLALVGGAVAKQAPLRPWHR